jgi:hypothetical protein
VTQTHFEIGQVVSMVSLSRRQFQISDRRQRPR